MHEIINTVTQRLTARRVEQIYLAFAGQRHGKHISAATDSDTTVEETEFAMRSAPRLYEYNKGQVNKPRIAVSWKSVSVVSRQS